MTRKKHIHKFLAPTQSWDNPANLFMFMCFSFPETETFGTKKSELYGIWKERKLETKCIVHNFAFLELSKKTYGMFLGTVFC